MKHYTKRAVATIARNRGLSLTSEWSGCDAIFPLLEMMRAQGATVLIKLDGERTGEDAKPYTVMVSGGPLGDDFFRTDTAALDDGLCYIIGSYSAVAWPVKG